MKQKIFIVVSFVLFFTYKANSQGLSAIKDFKNRIVSKRDNRWAVEKITKENLLGVGYQTVQNQFFSPNQYPGIVLTLNGSRVREMPKNLYIFDKMLNLGIIQLPKSETPTFSENARFSHSILRKINGNFAIGPQFSATLNTRLNTGYENNSLGGEAIIDLGPRLRLNKNFRLFAKTYGLTYNAALPLLGLAFTAPSFSTSFDANTNPKGLYTLNKYQRLQSQLFLTLPAKKRFPNKNYKIGYQWDYLHLDLGNSRSLYNAVHTISFIGNIHRVK